MTVRLLSGSLRAHEQWMNDNKIEKPIEQALQAQVSIGSSYHEHGSYFSKGRGGQNHGGTWRGERGRGGQGGIYNKSNVELSVIIAINVAIMQMSADQNVIIMLSIVLKKKVITNKMKRIMQY